MENRMWCVLLICTWICLNIQIQHHSSLTHDVLPANSTDFTVKICWLAICFTQNFNYSKHIAIGGTFYWSTSFEKGYRWTKHSRLTIFTTTRLDTKWAAAGTAPYSYLSFIKMRVDFIMTLRIELYLIYAAYC